MSIGLYRDDINLARELAAHLAAGRGTIEDLDEHFAAGGTWTFPTSNGAGSSEHSEV